MAIMEGPLSKWTNVMNGWQYRWFVLDENAGLLSYYTSKEKMMRGARRGCVRLKGAVIGIDDEDDSTFTITVDQKTFHFQARDSEEKEKWIDALETTIVRHSHHSRRCEGQNGPTMGDFEKKLSEADAYLQILIDQAKDMEKKIDETENEVSKEKYLSIKETTESMIESIKQSIVLLQIAKAQSPGEPQPAVDAVSLSSLTGEEPAETENPELTNVYTNEAEVTLTEDVGEAVSESEVSLAVTSDQSLATSSPQTSTTNSPVPNMVIPPVPDTSYSSSEDECFFDAEDGGSRVNGLSRSKHGEAGSKQQEVEAKSPPPVIASKDDYFDELYDDNDEEELESLDQHGSIITHLLSQVRIGMDLTKIVLPTFILEKRSLLEMFADFLAHPDLFVGICDQKTPRDRFVHCVRWYLSAFHAGRRSEVAKKPYNPILGETFQCYYDLPGQTSQEAELNTEGPVRGTTKNNVSFIAEQVSHHPPISAFYAEHYNNRISLDGYIWTKSKFLGLSIGVHMIGQAVISVLDYGEEYIITFPNGYGRSILTVPWVELGGKCQVSCAKTGYNATIDFHTKPFYGGKKDQITAEMYAPNEKKSFCTVKGEWNGVMWAKYNTGFNEKFVDTKTMPIVKKRVRPIDQQEEYESRRLWEYVTKNLKGRNIQEATANKHKLEQRQREEAKQRKEAGIKWETKHFHEVGEHWVYDRPLMKRLATEPKLQD